MVVGVCVVVAAILVWPSTGPGDTPTPAPAPAAAPAAVSPLVGDAVDAVQAWASEVGAGATPAEGSGGEDYARRSLSRPPELFNYAYLWATTPEAVARSGGADGWVLEFVPREIVNPADDGGAVVYTVDHGVVKFRGVPVVPALTEEGWAFTVADPSGAGCVVAPKYPGGEAAVSAGGCGEAAEELAFRAQYANLYGTATWY